MKDTSLLSKKEKMKEEHIGTAKVKTYIDITRTTITICWISLFVFWAIKIFGGNWFEIAVQNEKFVQVSNFIQNSWIKYLITFFTIGISNYFTLCAVCQKLYFRGKQALFAVAIIVSMWAIASFVDIDFLKSWYGYIAIIIFVAIYQTKWKKCLGVVAMILDFAFMTISMLVRNVDLYVYSNYLLSLILVFDMYIMVFLYYLYCNLIKFKKEIK